MKAEWTKRDNLSIETTGQNSKAILVIDKMPNSCDECEVRCDGYTAKEYSEKAIKRPTWCPLKPLPIRKEGVTAYQTRDGVWHKPSEVGYAGGWNACLEAITGENK